MFIKQVIIQGFKSYREQTVVEPFDRGHNVVVGRNGSGKSNFFYAIQFVLSDEFSHLRPEQRQALLHEGTGPRVISAYVEIIFDNTDGRLPIDKDEVYLRRLIGSKKDQYFLNKKIVTRTDVMNLLESAGFSRSNPYYIVKQGKINQMATAPDSQRLKLLREVAGTKVYDDKKEESNAILRETGGKLDKIKEFLRTIDDRLGTLKEEKEELKEYQKWDKQKRCLEHIIHEKELNDNKRKLQEMEASRSRSGAEQSELSSKMKEAQENVKSASKKHKDAVKEAKVAKEERDTLSTEQQQLVRQKEKLKFQINDLMDEVKGDNDSRKRAEGELEKLKKQIIDKEKELEQIKPQYEEMKRIEEDRTRDLALKEQKRKELYAKQGRGSQFTSKEERDKWIQNELKQLNKQIKDKEEHEKKITEDLKKDKEKRAVLDKKIQEFERDMERQKKSIDDYNKQYYESNKSKDQQQSQRKELYRQESIKQLSLSGLLEDLQKADQSLRSMAGKPILNGRDSVRKVLETFSKRPDMKHEVDSYYGPVIENFDCDKSVYMAVEVTAGNRLFHHIVETDKFGTKILKEMNNQRLPGEVTFMPLNRLHVKAIDYPQTPDAIPMISKLNYDQKYDKALRYIFGKTLICRNLEAATSLARTSGLDCVTLEGDQVSSKGSLTGGYFNTLRSRLEIQKTRTELVTQVDQMKKELEVLKEDIRKADRNISTYVSEMQRTETKNNKARDIFDKLKADIRIMREELNGIDKSRAPKEKSLQQCKSSLEAMYATKEGLESELHQELMEQLSVTDQKKVDELNDAIRRLTKENKEAFVKRMKLEAEKNKLENLLTNNLVRRKEELEQALQEISVEDRTRKLEESRTKLDDIEKRLVKINEDFKLQNDKVTQLNKKQKTEAQEVEKWKSMEKEYQEKLDNDAKDLEKIASKVNMLEKNIAECTQKIAELGALPSKDLHSKYVNYSTKQLFKEMEKANNQLKKYSHVNKKALDQFISFSEQKDKLEQRKEELDRADEKIKELMSVLEQRKCDAIHFTFKQVSKYFTEVFKKLVPSGFGQLVMKTATGNDEEEVVESSDSFTGVGISVSFTGKKGEMREMKQLSGGQKSLVALALIFAIQKCDPAPFYLFDEIDQALDAQHRKAVADMIHELSSDAQFITTTFRPELLTNAHKFYGVKFRNKVSHVECVSREEAADFVEDDTTHG